MSRIKDWLKRTPFYPLLRAVREALRPKSRIDRIERRDARQVARILHRVMRPGGNGVDVGAHQGDVLAEFIRLSPTGQHVAVEPIPEMAVRLQAAFPGATVHAAAVGDVPGTVEFQWVTSNPAFSGLKRRPDLRPGESIQAIVVRVVCLDDLIPPGFSVAVLKVDVEGAELGVLRGASRLLAENRPWVLLEHGSAAATYGTTTADITAEFARHRMGVWLMGDWLAGGPPLSADEFTAAVAGDDVWNFLAGPLPENVKHVAN